MIKLTLTIILNCIISIGFGQNWQVAILDNFKLHSPILGDTQDDTWQKADISMDLNNSKILIRNKNGDIDAFLLIEYKNTDVEIKSDINVKYSEETYIAKTLPSQDSEPCQIGIKRANTINKDKATTVYNNAIVSITIMCNTSENGGWVAYHYFFLKPIE